MVDKRGRKKQKQKNLISEKNAQNFKIQYEKEVSKR